jgi:hypothetical protein
MPITSASIVTVRYNGHEVTFASSYRKVATTRRVIPVFDEALERMMARHP